MSERQVSMTRYDSPLAWDCSGGLGMRRYFFKFPDGSRIDLSGRSWLLARVGYWFTPTHSPIDPEESRKAHKFVHRMFLLRNRIATERKSL